MPLVSSKAVLDPAFEQRYGVAAINIVDDLSIDAVLGAATELQAPVILQTSLKTVKQIGASVLYDMVRARAERAPVPVVLHLDHCPEREWITTCLRHGWNSVLFDGSHLDVAENTIQTAEVVAEAHEFGAQVEGEIETVMGVEDGVGSDERSDIHPIEVSSRFIEATGVDTFAPAVGTAHGLYASKPHLMPERVSELVALQPIPMVLHGGTGLTPDQFQDCIARGCAKVNISTALKIALTESYREFLDQNPGKHDPPSMFKHVRAAVQAMAADHIRIFGSAGKAPSGAAASASP
ncbi:MAG TPA: class II fructose-bisphosphate aldolase [Baekduia sp.]